MKKILFIIFNFQLSVFICVLFAQEESLSLQLAYDLAQQNYPLIKQKDLIRQTTLLSTENISKNFLPQFSVNGQATYQSDVTRVSIPFPGISIEPPSKDQYRILADINQLVYDGGMSKQQKNITGLNAEVEQEKIEVELYRIKERINQLFLGILYIDEQLKQVDLVKNDIDIGIKRVEAQVNNGVAFRSNLNVLKAELLKADQRAIELQSTRKGFLDVLSLFLNRPLTENIQLERPVVATQVVTTEIQRPELNLFSSQNKLLSGQDKLITSKNLPKASLFLQGGYGKPGLNILKNEFDFYYIGGVRLNWSLGGLYTQKRERQINNINKKIIDIQKETFLLNTNTEIQQQQSEIEKMQKLITTDNEIIDLRVSVKEAAKAQLENAVITANDYLREVNAEDQARQTRSVHQIQLLQAQINYQTITGK